MNYEEREALKTKGWKEFSETNDSYKKAFILVTKIIPAHYWRAKENLECRKDYKKCLQKIRGKKYYKGYELDIDHYSENWLYAQKARDFMQDGVFEDSIHFYDPIESKYLPPGYSEYQI